MVNRAAFTYQSRAQPALTKRPPGQERPLRCASSWDGLATKKLHLLRRHLFCGLVPSEPLVKQASQKPEVAQLLVHNVCPVSESRSQASQEVFDKVITQSNEPASRTDKLILLEGTRCPTLNRLAEQKHKRSHHTRTLPPQMKQLTISKGSWTDRADDKLIEILKEFSRQQAETNNEDELFRLEHSWTAFVDIGSNLEIQQLTNPDKWMQEQQDIHWKANLKNQQDAIWELLTTEIFYIKGLRVIIELFLASLLRLQQHSFLMEIDIDQLASNIVQVYETNRHFWLEYLRPMLLKSRANREPLNPALMLDAFVHIRNKFKSYYRYCLEHTSCLKYVKDKSSSNDQFKLYLDWCESQRDCERLRLVDLLAKPMQRLTRYSLLLKAIAKKTDDQDQLRSVQQMIVYLNKFVLTVDLELRRQDELELLNSVACRVGSLELSSDFYSDEISQLFRDRYNSFDLTVPLFDCPFKCHRQLLLNSQVSKNLAQLKFKDSQTSGKLDVVVLIFTDQLLVCKQKSNNRRPANLSNQSPGRNRVTAFKRNQNRGSLSTKQSTTLSMSQLDPQRVALIRPRAGSQSNSSRNSVIDQSLDHSMSSLAPRALSLILSPASTKGSPSSSVMDVSRRARGNDLPDHSPTNDNSLRSCHSSSSSLAGNAAREFFAKGNNDSFRSNDNQISEQATSSLISNGTRFKPIRAPYPIERLVLHELKDGQGVLCCQLNDSLTVATSFILYCPPPSSSGESSSSNNKLSHNQQQQDLQQAKNAIYLRAQDSNRSDNESINQLPVQKSLPGSRRSSETRRRPIFLSPAKQLVNIVKQAQICYRLVANLHGVQLANFERVADQYQLAEPTDESRQASMRSRWSSFRHPRSAGSTSRQPSSLEEKESEKSKARSFERPSVSSENQVSTELHGPTDRWLKAVREQHQSVLLNHAQRDKLSTYDFSYPIMDDQVVPIGVSLSSSCTDVAQLAVETNPIGSQTSVFEPANRELKEATSSEALTKTAPATRAEMKNKEGLLLSPHSYNSLHWIKASNSLQRPRFNRWSRASNSNNLDYDSSVVLASSSKESSRSAVSYTSSSSSAHSSPRMSYSRRGKLSTAWNSAPAQSNLSDKSDSCPVNNSNNPSEPQTESLQPLSESHCRSARRHLSELRRQNVILSVSGEHQSSLLWSQHTGSQFEPFEDAPETETKPLIDSQSKPGSFECVDVASTTNQSRSSSTSKRVPISVTLTRPRNEDTRSRSQDSPQCVPLHIDKPREFEPEASSWMAENSISNQANPVEMPDSIRTKGEGVSHSKGAIFDRVRRIFRLSLDRPWIRDKVDQGSRSPRAHRVSLDMNYEAGTTHRDSSEIPALETSGRDSFFFLKRCQMMFLMSGRGKRSEKKRSACHFLNDQDQYKPRKDHEKILRESKFLSIPQVSHPIRLSGGARRNEAANRVTGSTSSSTDSHHRLALSAEHTGSSDELEPDAEGALLDMNCLKQLIREQSHQDRSVDMKPAKAYLGFHEKIEQHKRMLEKRAHRGE